MAMAMGIPSTETGNSDKKEFTQYSKSGGDRKGDDAGCDCCVFSAMIFYAIIIVLVVLSGNTTVYIQDLYINPNATTLNTTTTNATNTTSIIVDLKFERRVAFFACGSFDEFKLSISYVLNRSIPVANQTVAGFSMGHNVTVHKKAVVEATALPAFNNFSGGALVVELVEMCKYEGDCASQFSDKPIRWKREAVTAAALVWLDASGNMLSQQPITIAPSLL